MPESCLVSLVVVEHFNVVKDHCPELGTGIECFNTGYPDDLAFQCRPERLHFRVDAPIDCQTGLCSLGESVGRCAGGWFGEEVVELACNVAFQASDDVLFGESFSGAPLDVRNGGWVPSHTDDDNAVERSVGLPVPSSVESVPACGFA